MRVMRDAHPLNFLTVLPISSSGYFSLAARMILLTPKSDYVQTFQRLPFSSRLKTASILGPANCHRSAPCHLPLPLPTAPSAACFWLHSCLRGLCTR